MTQQGFYDFLYDTCNSNTGAIKSYITAIRIIDELFIGDDVFWFAWKISFLYRRFRTVDADK